jgi:hypothetical protein
MQLGDDTSLSIEVGNVKINDTFIPSFCFSYYSATYLTRVSDCYFSRNIQGDIQMKVFSLTSL